MNLFWVKELVSKPAYDRNGKQIPFETYGGDYGGIILESDTDKELIEDLNKMVGTAGISRSSADELAKKKSLPKHSPHNPRGEIRVYNPQKPTPPNAPNPGVAANGEGANFQPAIPPHRLNPLVPMPKKDTPPPAMTQEPPAVPLEGFKPRMGRGGKKAQSTLP